MKFTILFNEDIGTFIKNFSLYTIDSYKKVANYQNGCEIACNLNIGRQSQH